MSNIDKTITKECRMFKYKNDFIHLTLDAVKLNREESELLAITKNVHPNERYNGDPYESLIDFIRTNYVMLAPQGRDRIEWVLFKKLYKLFSKIGHIEYDMENKMIDIFHSIMQDSLIKEGKMDPSSAGYFAMIDALQMIKIWEYEENRCYYRIIFHECVYEYSPFIKRKSKK